MYLLYLDEAGTPKSPDEKHFVLAGIAVFERQAYWLQNSLERLVSTLGHPTPETLEIHGSVIHSGRGWWRKMRREKSAAPLSRKDRGPFKVFPITSGAYLA